MKVGLTYYGNQVAEVTVTLSKRNLLALLEKVDRESSAKKLTRRGDPANYDHEPDLVVKVESDDAHYGQRGYGPGPCHPLTEAFIGGHTQVRQHTRSCPAYGNYQPPYEECNCGLEARR